MKIFKWVPVSASQSSGLSKSCLTASKSLSSQIKSSQNSSSSNSNSSNNNKENRQVKSSDLTGSVGSSGTSPCTPSVVKSSVNNSNTGQNSLSSSSMPHRLDQEESASAFSDGNSLDHSLDTSTGQSSSMHQPTNQSGVTSSLMHEDNSSDAQFPDKASDGSQEPALKRVKM